MDCRREDPAGAGCQPKAGRRQGTTSVDAHRCSVCRGFWCTPACAPAAVHAYPALWSLSRSSSARHTAAGEPTVPLAPGARGAASSPTPHPPPPACHPFPAACRSARQPRRAPPARPPAATSTASAATATGVCAAVRGMPSTRISAACPAAAPPSPATPPAPPATQVGGDEGGAPLGQHLCVNLCS